MLTDNVVRGIPDIAALAPLLTGPYKLVRGDTFFDLLNRTLQ
ncbi:hypothetical protein GCM10009744_39430 [Kribbella alba]|uniref:Uncharacterized protein n=1 Tax=Kribbella alba TaxID=190197 RepID=A0ABN2FFQ4_9ACTN